MAAPKSGILYPWQPFFLSAAAGAVRPRPRVEAHFHEYQAHNQLNIHKDPVRFGQNGSFRHSRSGRQYTEHLLLGARPDRRIRSSTGIEAARKWLALAITTPWYEM